MSKENLIAVKTALAEKYERLSCQANSETKTKAFAFRARKYRRQLDQLKRN